MKKLSKILHAKELGFSLAEALITLLIVCLITLASIPVLTKKRRTVSDGAHGQYICTLNSEGDYVEYYSETSSGDINNPDTWDLVQGTGYTDVVYLLNSNNQSYRKERHRCRFVAPLNARNFNVTVIGGGAGGHNGENEYTEPLKVESSGSGTFLTTSDNEYYNLILASGGAGGGGSPNDRNNGSAGPGGGGGAGGYIRVENLKLPKNNIYNYTVGNGGAGNTGNYHDRLRDKFLDQSRAGSGGESTFTGYGINFKIPGPSGGESVSCTKKKCRGGAKGVGTTASSIQATYFNDSKTRYSASGGADGGAGGNYCDDSGGDWACGRLVTIAGGTNSISSFELDDNNFPKTISYGNGGVGRGSGSGGWAGGYGTNGVLIISQYNKKYGNGGNAGKISNRFIPSIEGYIVASIPVAANANEKGGDVVAELYKNRTNNGIFLRSEGGAVPSTNTTEATVGEDSPWTYKGGGSKGGKCGNVTYYGAGYESQTKELDVCKNVKCALSYIDPVYIKTNNKKYDYGMQTSSGEGLSSTLDGRTDYETEREYASGSIFIPYGVDTLGADFETTILKNVTYNSIVKPLTSTGMDDYAEGLNILYFAELTKTNTGSKSSFFNFSNGDFGKYTNNDAAQGSAPNLSNYGCFFHEDVLEYERVCTESAVEEVTDRIYKEGRRSQNCPAAGNGVAFGAGGGGGYPGDLPGIGGKGGKGAPGAVIIEW